MIRNRSLQQPAVARTRSLMADDMRQGAYLSQTLRSHAAVEPIPRLALEPGSPRLVPWRMPKRHSNTELALPQYDAFGTP